MFFKSTCIITNAYVSGYGRIATNQPLWRDASINEVSARADCIALLNQMHGGRRLNSLAKLLQALEVDEAIQLAWRKTNPMVSHYLEIRQLHTEAIFNFTQQFLTRLQSLKAEGVVEETIEHYIQHGVWTNMDVPFAYKEDLDLAEETTEVKEGPEVQSGTEMDEIDGEGMSRAKDSDDSESSDEDVSEAEEKNDKKEEDDTDAMEVEY